MPVWLLLPVALLALTACGGGDTPEPGALAPNEAEALNDAADMLNSRTGADSALPASKAPAPQR